MSLLFLTCATTAFAQFHPFPASDTQPAAICTDCQGQNSSGQPNDGLPTYPYSSPVAKWVGRYLDSTSTQDYQNVGMRTARAERILLAPDTRGSAPPRVYMRFGSTLVAYSLDTFFSTSLAGPMKNVSVISTGMTNWGGHQPQEKIAPPDAWVYAEAKSSGWDTTFMDGQDRLGEFDVDDRGYVLIAYSIFGWGIVKDSGETGTKKLPKVSQVPPNDITPWTIISVKTGGKYYAVVSNYLAARSNFGSGHKIFDVTIPTDPVEKDYLTGSENGIWAWAKDDAHERLAIIDGKGDLNIYSYSDYVNGRSPYATFDGNTTKGYVSVTADGNGGFYAVQGDKIITSTISHIVGAGSSYRNDSLSPFSAPFAPENIQFSDKYLAVTGKEAVGAKNTYRLYLFKVTTTGLEEIDTKGFFQKYYHLAPSGYAEPYKESTLRDAVLMKWGSKSYVLYNADKLGDAYEISTGDTIAASVKNTTFGTANPNSKGTGGPFYGDIMTFKSTGSNTQWIYNVEWNFGNPENGSDNTKLSKTGNEVTYQYNGLNTSAKITAPKTVSVEVTNDSSINDSITVNLAVPSPRVGVKNNSSILATSNSAAFEVIAGDEFTDASDGVVEGHYGVWSIGTDTTNAKPNDTVPVGSIGPHTLNFTAKYGKYDSSFNNTGTPYSTSLSNIQYDVRPFTVALKTPTKSNSGAVTFSGSSRISTVDRMFTATQWSVTWTLKTAAGSDVYPPQTTTETKGVIPNYVVPGDTTIPSGSIVTVTATVLPSEVNAPSGYETDSDSMTLSTPNPKLTKSAGCSNALEACTMTITSITGASTADWTYSWTVKLAGSTVKTGSGNPLALSFTGPGTAAVTVTVTKGIFSVPVTDSFSVAGAICGAPPASDQLAISYDCNGDCNVGTEVNFSRDLWGYDDQECNTYTWNFGDGGATATGKTAKHTFNSKKTYTVSLTVKNSAGASTTVTKSVAIGGGSTGGGGDTCLKPTGLTITVTGCAGGTTCKTTETPKFNLTKTGAFATCDVVAWDFGDGGTSNKQSPSHSFTTTGSYDATVTVSNDLGSAQASVRINVTPGSTGGCSSIQNQTVYFEYKGLSSNCANHSSSCTAGEEIQFTAQGWNYSFQSCDNFEWNFDDGSALSTERNPKHVMQGGKTSYNVKLRVWNTAYTTGVTETSEVVMDAPAKVVPVLTYGTAFPKTGAKGKEITFTVTSNVDQTTGWKWTFGDGTAADSSQQAVVSKTNTIKHTFTKTGTFTVKVTGRNAEDVSTAPVGSTQDTITITDQPEYRYLLPVVVHAGGQLGSVWRTDVQVYNPDPNVSVDNPLDMVATFKGTDTDLRVTQSTFIYRDFMTTVTNRDEQGPVIITTKAKYPPQIWTRTYNQTANGTFGQFIPAIRLDSAGGGAAAATDGTYYLAGLRHDSRYRTNLGFVNPTNATITASIKVYDDRRLAVAQFTKTIDSFQLTQFPITAAVPNLSPDRPFSVEVTVPAGQWVIAYASYIDSVSNDPVFIQAVNDNDLSSADYRNNVIPGVGHITQGDGSWRSDVTIFNPDKDAIQFDLQYFNTAGQKVAETPGIVLEPYRFLQYSDLLKQGVLGDVPEGLGMIRINASTSFSNGRYPMTFARTYFDRGANGSFGQGIGGFSAARANVKAGGAALIPAVRSDDDYYTNIGLTNVGDVAATVTVTLLDPTTGQPGPQQTFTLQPNQSVVGQFNFGNLHEGTMKVTTNAGSVWAFASVIDRRTKDPEYVPGVPLQ